MAARRRPGKWWLVGGFWAVQGAVLYLALGVWMMLSEGVNGPAHPWGEPSWEGLAGVLTAPEFVLAALAGVGVVTAMQAALLAPVARPAPKRARGWPLWLSLGAAGLGAAALSLGALLGLIELAEHFRWTVLDLLTSASFAWVLGGWTAASWAVATPLLAAFCRRGTREDRLARIAAVLFLGTVVETAAIMPIDVMVRRKTDCYCGPSFGALTLCLAVVFFALGPAVLLPVLARRRKRWYAGRCDACAYDMSGCADADRCPECGAGWRVSTPRSRPRAMP